jgi:hypothetical protein
MEVFCTSSGWTGIDCKLSPGRSWRKWKNRKLVGVAMVVTDAVVLGDGPGV